MEKTVYLINTIVNIPCYIFPLEKMFWANSLIFLMTINGLIWGVFIFLFLIVRQKIIEKQKK
jgi:hypothetical protein